MAYLVDLKTITVGKFYFYPHNNNNSYYYILQLIHVPVDPA